MGFVTFQGVNFIQVQSDHDIPLWSIPILAMGMQLKQGATVPVAHMGCQAIVAVNDIDGRAI